ncbi:MAG TPA: SRPBCC family protein, partial [Candidatus Hydrogenedentes bacterium]|nr:SRPBCC family protein [Candidatus Hydrogenedentota bacterium]
MMRLLPVLISFSMTTLAGPVEELDKCLTQENLERIEKNELVVYKMGAKDADGSAQAFGRVLTIINRPKQDIWRLLSHAEEHLNYQPHLVAVARYKTEDGQEGLKETVRVAFKTFTYHIIETYDEEAGVITWRLDKSRENSIRDTRGSWVIRPHGEDRCIVMYT